MRRERGLKLTGLLSLRLGESSPPCTEKSWGITSHRRTCNSHTALDDYSHSHRRTCNSHTALDDYSHSHRWRSTAIAAPVTATQLYIGHRWRCPVGCSDFDFFHNLRYNHPSLTPWGSKDLEIGKKKFSTSYMACGNFRRWLQQKLDFLLSEWFLAP